MIEMSVTRAGPVQKPERILSSRILWFELSYRLAAGLGARQSQQLLKTSCRIVSGPFSSSRERYDASCRMEP